MGKAGNDCLLERHAFILCACERVCVYDRDAMSLCPIQWFRCSNMSFSLRLSSYSSCCSLPKTTSHDQHIPSDVECISLQFTVWMLWIIHDTIGSSWSDECLFWFDFIGLSSEIYLSSARCIEMMPKEGNFWLNSIQGCGIIQIPWLWWCCTHFFCARLISKY